MSGEHVTICGWPLSRKRKRPELATRTGCIPRTLSKHDVKNAPIREADSAADKALSGTNCGEHSIDRLQRRALSFVIYDELRHAKSQVIKFRLHLFTQFYPACQFAAALT